MCAVILKSMQDTAESLPISVTAGIDIIKEIDWDDDHGLSIERATAEGGWMSGGPVCTFCGKKMLCFIATAPNALINSSLLASVLKTIDKAQIYERTEGRISFLLLDGHHSSGLALPFLEYHINKEETK